MTRKKANFDIIFAGGGTAGPVVPLLAVYEYLRAEHTNTKVLLIGTKNGPEHALAAKIKLPSTWIVAPKLRRYWSWHVLWLPFSLFIAILQSLRILNNAKPKVICGAGGYVQVPVCIAGWILRIPYVVHQQDIIPSLANKIVAMGAATITTTFEKSLQDFARGITINSTQNKRTVWIGNPFRPSLKNGDKPAFMHQMRIKADRPIILFMGGGTGSAAINEFVWSLVGELIHTYEIIHITGKGKHREISSPHYHQLAFVDDMSQVYAAADVVVCRAGLSTITELAALKKPAIVIPLPNSHQEANGAWLEAAGCAVVLQEKLLSGPVLLAAIHDLLNNHSRRKEMIKSLGNLLPGTATGRMAKILMQYVKPRHE